MSLLAVVGLICLGGPEGEDRVDTAGTSRPRAKASARAVRKGFAVAGVNWGAGGHCHSIRSC